MTEERKYRIKMGWIFNLEAMHDKLWCLIYDAREGEVQFPLTIANRVCKDVGDIMDVMEEAETLEWIAKSRKVTSREYGRIKAMAEWRITQRYVACMASGMSERDAGQCWEDM